MGKFLVFGIHGNNRVEGDRDFFRKSFKKCLEKCGSKIDVHIEGIYDDNIKKNNLVLCDFFFNEVSSFKESFSEIYELESNKLFNSKHLELNSFLYKRHFSPDLFGIGDFLTSDPIRFNLIPEKQNLIIDFSIWKYMFLKERLEEASKQNISPVLVVMDFLKSQVDSLFARDEMLNSLINKGKQDDVIVLRGYLHSPSKDFIKSGEDKVFESVLNDEVLKAYKLFLNHNLDYNNLMELSKSYFETYKRLSGVKSFLNLEEYKKIILNK
jgi:hypothetical protein